jgi:DNA-binding CsgD family transcriptional regulator
MELSPREKQCLSWAAEGKSSWDISIILRISENTVNFHVKNAMKKLGVSRRSVAAIKAIGLGIIKSPGGDEYRSRPALYPADAISEGATWSERATSKS